MNKIVLNFLIAIIFLEIANIHADKEKVDNRKAEILDEIFKFCKKEIDEEYKFNCINNQIQIYKSLSEMSKKEFKKKLIEDQCSQITEINFAKNILKIILAPFIYIQIKQLYEFLYRRYT